MGQKARTFLWVAGKDLDVTPETSSAIKLAAGTVVFSLPIQRLCVFLVGSKAKQQSKCLQKYTREMVRNCVQEEAAPVLACVQLSIGICMDVLSVVCEMHVPVILI